MDPHAVVIQCFGTISSLVSLCGCSYVLLRIARRVRSGQSLVVTDPWIAALELLYAFSSVCNAFGQAFIPRAGEPPGAWCLAQAVCTQFFGLAALVWTAMISLLTLNSLRPGQVQLSTRPRSRHTLAPLSVTLLGSASCAAALGFMDGYGDAAVWCWVREDRPAWQLGFYYAPLVLAWAVCLCSLVCVRRQLSLRLGDACHTSREKHVLLSSGEAASGEARAEAPRGPAADGCHCALISADAAETMDATRRRRAEAVVDSVVIQVTRYLVVFVCFHVFGLINRTSNLVMAASGQSHRVIVLDYLQAMIDPLQGFGNALVYSGLYTKIANQLQSGKLVRLIGWARVMFAMRKITHVAPVAVEAITRNSSVSEDVPLLLPDPELSSFSIFAATWNMGESEVPDAIALAKWLPPRKSVYVISLQECLAVDDFVSAATSAVSTTGKYVSYVKRIGSSRTALGYHGYIAIAVLVSADLVLSGAWREVYVASSTVKRGKRVAPSRRLSNKGAVALAFRLHETTLAFIACHFTSDSKGRSHQDNRDKDTQRLLGEMELCYDALGFELQLCCHHVILLGDLNYRVELSTSDAIDSMAKGAWPTLLEADQLTKGMARHQVLRGFREAQIGFLPTYRRVKGDAGSIAQLTIPCSPSTLQAAYSLELSDGTTRTPSYTDRVLLASLPDLVDMLQVEEYFCYELFVCSDHRPVCAEVTLRAHREGRRALASTQLRDLPPHATQENGSAQVCRQIVPVTVRPGSAGPCHASAHEAVAGQRQRLSDQPSSSPGCSLPPPTSLTVTIAASVPAGGTGSVVTLDVPEAPATPCRAASALPLSLPKQMTPGRWSLQGSIATGVSQTQSLVAACSNLRGSTGRATNLSNKLLRPCSLMPKPERGPRLLRTVPCTLQLRQFNIQISESYKARPAAGVIVIFPLPAEDPSFAIHRVARLFGWVGTPLHEPRSLQELAETGYRHTAEISVVATKSVHALIKVVDSEHTCIGQTVLTLRLPWFSPGEFLRHTRPISLELTVTGQLVGAMELEATVTWDLPDPVAIAAGFSPPHRLQSSYGSCTALLET